MKSPFVGVAHLEASGGLTACLAVPLMDRAARNSLLVVSLAGMGVSPVGLCTATSVPDEQLLMCSAFTQGAHTVLPEGKP